MPLSIADRKHRMPHGALLKVARRKKVSPAYVTAVMNGTARAVSLAARRKLHAVQTALAKALELELEQVFASDEIPSTEADVTESAAA